MKRCATCKHWNEDTELPESWGRVGTCRILHLEMINPYKVFPVFGVSADFGCVRHEERIGEATESIEGRNDASQTG